MPLIGILFWNYHTHVKIIQHSTVVFKFLPYFKEEFIIIYSGGWKGLLWLFGPYGSAAKSSHTSPVSKLYEYGPVPGHIESGSVI